MAQAVPGRQGRQMSRSRVPLKPRRKIPDLLLPPHRYAQLTWQVPCQATSMSCHSISLCLKRNAQHYKSTVTSSHHKSSMIVCKLCAVLQGS
eukprot:scaffold181355_cov36-Prasinocladus_malaysianus.AAC.1